MPKLVEICTVLSVALAALSYLHFDPASPIDPFFARDPKPDATPERRAAMWREYELLRADPWGIAEPPPEVVDFLQSKLVAQWPTEFPPTEAP